MTDNEEQESTEPLQPCEGCQRMCRGPLCDGCEQKLDVYFDEKEP